MASAKYALTILLDLLMVEAATLPTAQCKTKLLREMEDVELALVVILLMLQEESVYRQCVLMDSIMIPFYVTVYSVFLQEEERKSPL